MVKAKLQFIDCLRGVAIFGVLLRHMLGAADKLPGHPTLTAYLRSGQYGVQLFFVVSSFTLFLSLDRRRSDERRPWRNFFIRRFFRIAPMFWAALIFYWIKQVGPAENPSAGPMVQKGVAALFGTATFVNDVNPHWINSIVPGGWSVATETLFYLMMPLLFLGIKSLRSAVILFLIAAAGAFVLFHYATWADPLNSPSQRQQLRQFYVDSASYTRAHPGQNMVIPDNLKGVEERHMGVWMPFLYFWLPNQFPVFVLGCVLFFLYRRLGEPGRRTQDDAGAAHPRRQRGLAIGLLLIASAMLACAPMHEFRYLPPHDLYGVGAVLLACSLAIYQFPLLVNAFWQYLGKISYSVYLTHWALLWPLVYWIRPWEGEQYVSLPRLGLVFLLELPLAILVASVTFYLIEQPGQALGKRIIARLEGVKERRPAEAAAV